MINRQNFKDVGVYLQYHKRILQNKKASLATYENQLRYALKWADETQFPDCCKKRNTFPAYLMEKVNEGVISESWGADICALFRDFLKFFIAEDKARYGGIKQSQIDSIRIISHTDSTKTALYYTLDEMEKIANIDIPKGQKELGLKRARASACFLFLSGMRISAFLSLPIECVDLDKRAVHQFPELGVVTKFSKKASTTLLPIPFLLDVVKDWGETLKQYSIPSGALWYADIAKGGKGLISAFPVKRDHDKAYSIARTKGTKFRERYLHDLCDLAGIDYKNPHAFRHGHVHWGISNAHSMEQVKAISQNVMHGSTAITDEIYSRMNYTGVSDTISKLGTQTVPVPDQGGAVSGLLSSMTAEEKKQLLRELLGL